MQDSNSKSHFSSIASAFAITLPAASCLHYYGDPRYTQDIDIVVLLQPEQAQRLVDEMENEYYINRESVMEAVREQGLFQALDNETYIKLDFHVGEGIPGELSRSREVSLFPGLTLRVPSIEDAIASKLRWIGLGSHRSREDVNRARRWRG